MNESSSSIVSTTKKISIRHRVEYSYSHIIRAPHRDYPVIIRPIIYIFWLCFPSIADRYFEKSSENVRSIPWGTLWYQMAEGRRRTPFFWQVRRRGEATRPVSKNRQYVFCLWDVVFGLFRLLQCAIQNTPDWLKFNAGPFLSTPKI